MKWGVRRYQNKNGSLTNAGSKRYYKKSLNKSDQEYANAAAKYMHADRKSTSLSGKNQKLLQKSKTYSAKGNSKAAQKTLQKVSKNTTKMDRYTKEAKSAQSMMDAAESKTWKLLAEAVTNGYSVTSKKTIRNGDRGRVYAAQMMGGIIGNTAYTSAMSLAYGDTYRAEYKNGTYVNQNPSMIIGNKYSVR